MANPYPIRIQGTDGVAILNGEATFTDPANQPGGGGSQPGGLTFADYDFDEPGAAHADLTASLVLPANSRVLDVWLYGLVTPWTDSVHLVVTDGVNTYFTNQDVNNTLPDPYDALSLNGFAALQKSGDDYSPAAGFATSGTYQRTMGGVLYPAGGTIAMTLTGIATGGGGAKLRVSIPYVTIAPIAAA